MARGKRSAEQTEAHKKLQVALDMLRGLAPEPLRGVRVVQLSTTALEAGRYMGTRESFVASPAVSSDVRWSAKVFDAEASCWILARTSWISCSTLASAKNSALARSSAPLRNWSWCRSHGVLQPIHPRLTSYSSSARTLEAW